MERKAIPTVAVSFLLVFLATAQGKRCPGFCTKDVRRCTSNHGKIVGYCTLEMACCDLIAGVTGTCGSSFKRLNTTFFKSPHFPKTSSGDLTCEFKLKLYEESVGVRIDFIQFKTDGLSYGHAIKCDSDMMFIRGFETWTPPPRCGDWTGYSLFIDRNSNQAKEMETLSLLAIMSSPGYLWNIKVTQIYNQTKPVPGTEKGQILSISSKGRSIFTQTEWNLPKPNQKSKVYYQSVEENDVETIEFNTTQRLGARSSSIINGENTEITRVPWQASLRLFFPSEIYQIETGEALTEKNCSATEGVHFCGGSIVGNQHILTAAHCFYGSEKPKSMIDLSKVKVVLGDTNKCKDTDSMLKASQYDIERVILHYAYDGNIVDNDIALVKLKKKIEMKMNILSVRMAESGFDYSVGEMALVSGWGLTELEGSHEDQETPDHLQSSNEFRLEDKTFCQEILEETLGASPDAVKKHVKYEHVYEGVFCTGTQVKTPEEVHTGAGDSGGGLLIFDNQTGEYVQLGIVSYALTFKPNNTEDAARKNGTNGIQDCLKYEYVDYFQSVPYYREWIDLVLLQ